MENNRLMVTMTTEDIVKHWGEIKIAAKSKVIENV